MKKSVTVLCASRERQHERDSGFTYPGKIVAAARWVGKGSGETKNHQNMLQEDHHHE